MEKTVLKFYIEGSRQFSNIFWAIAISLGGIGFFLSGLSSYFKNNLSVFSDATQLLFIPQGIILLFYGTIGLVLGIFLWLTIWWDIGYGHNEFNLEQNTICLSRNGFPGKNRDIFVRLNFRDVKSIKMRIQNGLSPKRQLFLCLVDNREIPLTVTTKLSSLKEIESEAVSLSNCLNVKLKSECY